MLNNDQTKTGDAPNEHEHLLNSRQQPKPNWQNYKQDEEVTLIFELTYLKFSPFKAYLLVPILSLISVFIFAIALYWSPSLRVVYCYTKETKRNKATHILVKGHLNALTILPLYSTSESGEYDTFCYRFIQFRYSRHRSRYEPVLFPITMPQSEIL